MKKREKITLFIAAILGSTLILLLILWSTSALTGGLVDQTTDFFLPENKERQKTQLYQAVLSDSLLKKEALAIIKEKEALLSNLDALTSEWYQSVEEDLAIPLSQKIFSKEFLVERFQNRAHFRAVAFFQSIQKDSFYIRNVNLKDLLPILAKAKIDIDALESKQLQDLLKNKREQ